MYRWQQMVESLTGNGSKEERGYMVADNRAAFGTAAPMAVPNAMMSNRVMSKSMADGAVAFEEATAAGMDVEAVMEEIRSAFSDVAYWYPTLRTDERGEVRVTVRYPDDLTRWNEYFVAMKRLGKPCWMLNYTGEPHWPMKMPNRKDFQQRMFQFFNHYLKGEPMPRWMSEGVPAVDQPFELGY